MAIDISKYIKAAKTQTEKDADALLSAYLIDLVQAREATIDEVAKAYGKYLQGVDPANYIIEMNKNGRLQKLIDAVTEIQLARERADNKKLENQSKIGTNQYYYMMFIYAAFGVVFEDMDDATYYAIIGRTPDAKITINGKVQTVGDYLKETVKDKATRDDIYRQFFAKGGGNTIDLIKNMDAESKAKIEKIIRDGIASGKSYKDIGILLRKQFDGMGKRADTIARTEAGRALAASQFRAYQEAKDQGVNARRMWKATFSIHTRDQSQQMDGQYADENDLFHYPDGSTGRYPRDSGNPAYDINEKCYVIDIVEGDTQSETMSQRSVTGGDHGLPLSEANLATETGRKSFKDWAKSNGITKNMYGELFTFRE